MTTNGGISPKSASLTVKERNFLMAWVSGLTLLILLVGFLTVVPQRRHSQAAVERHQARMSPTAEEPGTTKPDLILPDGASPATVDVGLYIDRISEFSVRDVSWTVDFYIWFRWSGNAVRPGDDLRIVDGSIESKEKEDEFTSGDQHYERYRVVARITKSFDVSQYPLDEHLLTINVENSRYQRHQLLFSPDTSNTNVSSRVRVPAYEVAGSQLIEKPHSYKTTQGDPRLQPNSKATYSQARLGISLQRTGWGYFFKMFQSLYVAVMIALLAMFIKPTNVDPRFGLGIGGLFAAVANSYVTSSLIPDTGVMTLADSVNCLGVWMILLTVMQSTISLYLFEHRGAETLSRCFDQVSFAVLSAGYVVLNIALPLAAS